jgi:hypothetical protein
LSLRVSTGTTGKNNKNKAADMRPVGKDKFNEAFLVADYQGFFNTI